MKNLAPSPSPRLLIAVVALLFAVTVPGFAELKAPETVKGALRILNQVVRHTERLMKANDYATIPHEHAEFVEGAAMLREGLANEPAEFKAQVETVLDKSVAASAALGEAAQAADADKVAAAHATFAAIVKMVTGMFPEEIRPQPRR